MLYSERIFNQSNLIKLLKLLSFIASLKQSASAQPLSADNSTIPDASNDTDSNPPVDLDTPPAATTDMATWQIGTGVAILLVIVGGLLMFPALYKRSQAANEAAAEKSRVNFSA